MDSLGSVRTIVGIAQDILSIVETASRNKSRCQKVANRVRCLRDILEAMDAAEDGTTTTTTTTMTTDVATRRLMDRLEEALKHALQVVRRCQRTSFLRSVIIAGGRMADPLDEVQSEIDRCILDLAVANSVRIARLETLLRQRNVADRREEDGDKDENKTKGSAEKDHEDTTVAEGVTVTTIGVPVCTAAAAVHEHGMVPPPPPYGYGDGHWRFSHGRGPPCDSWDNNNAAGGLSDVGFSYYNQYSSYPSVFSDDNPHSCAIT